MASDCEPAEWQEKLDAERSAKYGEVVAREIETSKAKIRGHRDAIAQIFVDLGYAKEPEDVKLTVGPELECTEIAGSTAFIERTKQLIAEVVASARKGDANPTHDINDKKGAYMPLRAQIGALDALFAGAGLTTAEREAESSAASAPASNNRRQTKLLNATRVAVEAEPAWGMNVWDEAKLPQRVHGGFEMEPEKVAASQIEFSSPPRTPEGAAAWLNAMMDKAVNGAKSIGLKRIDFRAVPHQQTAPNSIHLNSVITVKGKNAFSACEWNDKLEDFGKPSDLALCIGKAHIDYLKHSLFMFARGAHDYDRLRTDQVSGPTYFGMPTRKEHGRFGTAMFRGEKRQTERTNSTNPDKDDKGPMRFELRVPCPGAAGHPNKSAYPQQEALAYEMMEAYMHMLRKGVEMWKKRELARRKNEIPPQITEEQLHPDAIKEYLYDDKADAIRHFTKSREVREYWGDRIKVVLALSEQQDKIYRKEFDPYPISENHQASEAMLRKVGNTDIIPGVEYYTPTWNAQTRNGNRMD